ncbi:hypothetical protein HU200_046412 [Digitaria exilis]|uniref:Peptidase S8/S53 domain-containing protein n=1 Tax=Digitaria exilis TaxID=1010633 RepID=A0A835AYF0_9POAL|nr:hypothetical protein HU200_046412 [Digitaria exilis]
MAATRRPRGRRALANVSYGGLAPARARGACRTPGWPSTRCAWAKFCSSADILAGFDDAIADGVDIISFSIGWHVPDAVLRICPSHRLLPRHEARGSHVGVGR